MSAALVAGRCRLNAVIINAEAPRNRVTTASHGFLTRDGIHPLEMLRIAKEQLKKYATVQYINDQVDAVASVSNGFEATLGSGTIVRAKRVLISTGFRDDLGSLNLPGIEKVYGKSVYPCPFCDGFEHADERIALFGGEGVEHYAPLLKMWTRDIVVFTNGRTLSERVAAELARNGVGLRQERITELQSTNGALEAIVLEGGERVQRDSGFLFDDAGEPSNNFAAELGVGHKTSAWGSTVVDADESGVTNIEGVYVVGDARTGFSGLMFAASEGGGCVEQIVHTISQQRWQKVPGSES